jgi:ribosomal protein S18 acetylase RimI-like enzyme
MTNPHQVLLIEELAMNAHPALTTRLYDGWVLRFSNGYTKRANSVNPVYPSVLPFDEKIASCEHVYRAQKLPVVFKLTRALSGTLDGELARRGYGLVAPTDVMTTALTGDARRAPDFHVTPYVTDGWAGSFFALNGLTEPGKAQTARQMLDSIQSGVLCGSIVKNGRTIAVGLCVIERGFAGLFDIVVDQAYRGRGYGFELCASLLSEVRNNGAETAYLQVVQTNAAALALYGKLGFEKAYDYWYRVKE